MERATIELEVPSAVLDVARSIAEAQNSSVEAVLQDGFEMFLAAAPSRALALKSMEAFSDEQLWAIAHRPLSWAHDLRWRELQVVNKRGALTAEESAEMDELLAARDRQVLLRSKALVLMKRRGHDIDSYLGIGD